MVVHRSVAHRLAALGLGAMIFVAAACGADVDPLSQQHIGGERFVRVDFVDVPRPAEAVRKTYVRDGDLQTETFDVADASAEAVLAFYETRLAEEGWTVVDEPLDTRDGTLVTFERMGRSLAVLTDRPDPEGPATLRLDYISLDRPGGTPRR
ncbi:MAG: hypothetical protein OEY23_13095 [Acidimicrobiia bacterium]|nr:hypothetical protein [Acidimicrobiia bacterium]